MITGKAIIITGGLLHDIHAKTAHGLVRGSERFQIVGIIDDHNAGKDAGEVVDGVHRDIPIFSSLAKFIKSGNTAEYAVLGVATKGGVIPEELRELLRECINAGISVVNGLHEHLSAIPDLAKLAAEKGVDLIDIRKPKDFKDVRFWNGEIIEVKCPKIAVLGTDCALGKRTTTRFICERMKEQGFSAEMIYTGQTGWMQGAKYGFIFDATLNDFVSGEIEAAILECYRSENPDYILIEGQSSLKNPSGPCGSEFIVSGRLDGVILQHHPNRVRYKDMEYYPDLISTAAQEIELIKMYGAPVIGLSLNTMEIKEDEAREYQIKLEAELNIPVVLPLFDGVDRLVEACKFLSNEN